jgi:hypothetical protein
MTATVEQCRMERREECRKDVLQEGLGLGKLLYRAQTAEVVLTQVQPSYCLRYAQAERSENVGFVSQ